jgi:acyl-CoA synthetase (AMP-forming)/AMP-acid ligase II
MTETSPVSTQTRIGDSIDQQCSTVGRVHPHLELKIVDPDGGQCVPRGQKGELCTRGYSVMHGYWGDKSKTDEVLDAVSAISRHSLLLNLNRQLNLPPFQTFRPSTGLVGCTLAI